MIPLTNQSKATEVTIYTEVKLHSNSVIKQVLSFAQSKLHSRYKKTGPLIFINV